MTSRALNPNHPFADHTLARELLGALHARAAKLERPLRFMEVCGTHTVSFFRSGLRGLLPENLGHVSGPGCPVCVTHDQELATMQELAARPDTIIATFGDMLRVPGHTGRSLKHAQAEGAQVVPVHSPLDALKLAGRHPRELVIFIAAGFETTLPATAAAVLEAGRMGIDNFCLFNCHKSVPPALVHLLDRPEANIDVFLLPGHVITITGIAPFAFLAERGYPAAVTGFESSDLISALCRMLDCVLERRPELVNAYARAAHPQGNPRARAVMERVFEPCDALWRGLGIVPGAGLRLREKYREFDAVIRLKPECPEVVEVAGCRCGDVLRGVANPPDCPLFGTACTPASPVGPCMVSTEGSCAAWHLYGMHRE